MITTRAVRVCESLSIRPLAYLHGPGRVVFLCPHCRRRREHNVSTMSRWAKKVGRLPHCRHRPGCPPPSTPTPPI